MNIKKIVRVILVLLLVAIYANIGYWIGQTWHNAQGQANPSTLDLFFFGPNRIMEITTIKANPLLTSIIFSILWPFIMALFILIWLIYFLFFGGLFRTIGLIPSILAGIFLLLIVRIHVRKRKTG